VDTVHKQVKGSKSAREKTTPPPMVILEKTLTLTAGTNSSMHIHFLPLNFSHLYGQKKIHTILTPRKPIIRKA